MSLERKTDVAGGGLEGLPPAGQQLTHRVARLYGASRAWVVESDTDELLARLLPAGTGVAPVRPLDGLPVCCRDLRLEGELARKEGRALLVDDAICGPWGCAAVRLGAHLAWTCVGGYCLVGVSRDVERVLPAVSERLRALPQPSEGEFVRLSAVLDASERSWHAQSDAAQVVASYLRCHPRVSELRYPGLKEDESFAVAARTLQGGFGPLVDYRVGKGGWQSLICKSDDPRAQVLALERTLAG